MLWKIKSHHFKNTKFNYFISKLRPYPLVYKFTHSSLTSSILYLFVSLIWNQRILFSCFPYSNFFKRFHKIFSVWLINLNRLNFWIADLKASVRISAQRIQLVLLSLFKLKTQNVRLGKKKTCFPIQEEQFQINLLVFLLKVNYQAV